MALTNTSDPGPVRHLPGDIFGDTLNGSVRFNEKAVKRGVLAAAERKCPTWRAVRKYTNSELILTSYNYIGTTAIIKQEMHSFTYFGGSQRFCSQW